MRKIVIIGGGLAGLISSIQLARAGIACVVIEKKSYPFHRVCGEYVSNEVAPFLKSAGLYPEHLNLPRINFFEFSSCDGQVCRLRLDLGGFGISRYCFDHFLYTAARREGVTFLLNTEAIAVKFDGGGFEVKTPHGLETGDVVIGSFGKRSRIDVQQNREFIRKRSPYVGVKYHIRTHQPEDLISIHNFPGGYCGVSNIEDGVTNLCYLVRREQLKKYGDIPLMETATLHSNPLLKKIFGDAGFLFQKPEVINEVSFETKGPVENHILMAGDAAGMIAPVCGNGMAMAIHSGKIVARAVQEYCAGRLNRERMENQYRKEWNAQFRTRLMFGRYLQQLFGHRHVSNFAVRVGRFSSALSNALVSRTHGQPF